MVSPNCHVGAGVDGQVQGSIAKLLSDGGLGSKSLKGTDWVVIKSKLNLLTA